MNAALRPRVSVIVAASANSNSLRYAIESVVNQTFVNFEVWVVGNNCHDHSEDIVNSFCDPRIFWFDLPTTRSNFQLVTEGLKRSRGEYVAFLNPDDLWLPNHLQTLVEWIESIGSDIVFSITQCILPDSYSFLTIPLLPDLAIVPNPSSVLHKKNCVFVTLPEDESQPDFNTEFFRRAKEEKLRMEVVPVTTGLKFLGSQAEHNVQPQRHYMEKLKHDPDFINKELSAILFRTRREESEKGSSWVGRMGKALHRMMDALRGGSEYPKHDPTVRASVSLNLSKAAMSTKGAKAV